MARVSLNLPTPNQLTSRIVQWQGANLGALGALGGGNLTRLELAPLNFSYITTSAGDMADGFETGQYAITLQATGVADIRLAGPAYGTNARRDSSAPYSFFYGSASRSALNTWLAAVLRETNPSFSVILDDGVAPPDLMPGFAGAAVADQVYTEGTRIPTLQLPAAESGDAPLAYSLTPPLPAGLAFDSATRRVTGTPTAAAAEAVYTFTVTDADGDTAEISFSITVEAAGPGPVPQPVAPEIPRETGTDLGLDDLWEAANVTKAATGWRGRVEAFIEAMLGAAHPFGTAATADVGITAGKAVETDRDGRVHPDLLPAVAQPAGIRDFQIANTPLGEGEFTEDMDIHCEDRDGVLFIELSYSRVSAGEDPAVPVPEPAAAPTVAGLDQTVEVKLGETFEDTVTLSDPEAELSATLQAETIAAVAVRGTGAERRLLYTPAAVGSTAGTVTASRGTAERRYPVGVAVRPAAGTPLVGPEATGIRPEVTILVGAALADDFRVTPADAVVTLDVPPDAAVAQGVLAGNAFDGTGNRRVTWAGAGRGIASGTIRVANRADETVFAEYLVQIAVNAVAPGPAPDPPRAVPALRITGLRASMQAEPGSYLADDFGVTIGEAQVTAASDNEAVATARVIGEGTDRRVLVETHQAGDAVITVTASHGAAQVSDGLAVAVRDPAAGGGPIL